MIRITLSDQNPAGESQGGDKALTPGRRGGTPPQPQSLYMLPVRPMPRLEPKSKWLKC